MKKLDLIVIGGGAGAFAAAIRANELGAETVIVNTGLPIGGTCVNVGCVPSKTLIYAGEVLYRAKHHGIPGVRFELKEFNFQKVIEDELALVNRLREEKYEKVLKHLQHVELIEGKAQFVGPHEIEVHGEKIWGEKFIIAVGSTAIVPPIENIRDIGFVTHIEALQLKKQPQKFVIVGAGPLGLEFGQMYSRFGTKVTILQRGSSLFEPGEKELTDRLKEILVKEGVEIKMNVEVKKARRENDKRILTYFINQKSEEIEGDVILLASGKTPNTQDLGLDKAGVETNQRHAINVNEFFQTLKPHIFAVGDVANLPLRLEPTAGHEGTLAAENALTGSKKVIDYDTVPYTIFTDPQLAGVGFTEQRQMKKMGVCACRTVSFADVPKATVMRQTDGLIKMAIHPGTRQILGVHVLAPNAADIIAHAMILIKNKNTIDDVIDSLPVFPSLSEAIKIAALSFTKDISKLSCCI